MERSVKNLVLTHRLTLESSPWLDEGHCTSNITYCFETKYCGKPTCECKFNCEPWAFSDGSEVPSQLKEAGIAVAMD